jgi:RNA ligase
MTTNDLGFTLQQLNDYIEQGYVNKVKHPKHDIYIYKYTFKTAMEKKWDAVTLSSRSLVLDESGNVVSLPFAKFFNNRQELKVSDVIIDEIGNQKHFNDRIGLTTYFYENRDYVISQKLDGSFIQMFLYKDEIIFTSSSTFDSEHAKVAEEMFWDDFNTKNSKETYSDKVAELKSYLANNTIMFEMIHPNYRIVVDYGNTKELYLIGIRNKNDGKYWGVSDLSVIAHEFLWEQTNVYPTKTLNDALEQQKTALYENIEGYVVYFPKVDFRVKIKLNSYFEAHKLVSNLTDKNILINFCINGGDELWTMLPDEFLEYVKIRVKVFEEEYNRIDDIVQRFYIDNIHLDRKDYAIKAQKEYNSLMSLLMSKYLVGESDIWGYMLKNLK